MPSSAMARPESFATITEYGSAGAISSRGARPSRGSISRSNSSVPGAISRTPSIMEGAIFTAKYDCRRIMHDPLIFALDFDSARDADALVNALGDSGGFYKVGMELYAATGMDYVRSLIDRGKQVFLDLKFYDIGETVKRAVSVATKSGATFLTVHAIGQVMRAAIEGKGSSNMKLLAVTVLTSLDQADLNEMGHDCTVTELVAARVNLARKIGIAGIVTSALEARSIRALAG